MARDAPRYDYGRLGNLLPAMFEILEHTADIGFRARGRTAQDLFTASSMALVSVALETVAVSPRAEYPLEAAGCDRESLLVNWLSEVLFLLDGRQLVFHHFRIDELTSASARGVGVGEPRDPARHQARLIVKGVTYHQLRIEQDEQGWSAEVYLDI